MNQPPANRCPCCRKGDKSNTATVAFDFGFTWPDGRTLYTLACDTCAANVFRHQGLNLGETFTCTPADKVEIVPTCHTYWRSHGCKWPSDAEHEHECDCDDRPTEDDVLY